MLSDWVDFIQKLSSIAVSVGAILGGGWTLYIYTKNRRYNAALWINKLFGDFYINDTFDNIKKIIQYKFENIVKPTIEKCLSDTSSALTSEEVDLLEQLDKLLNFFEHVLYLEEQNHLKKSDRCALLEYWFCLIAKNKYIELIQYIAMFDYERIEKELHRRCKIYFIFYGTLRQGFEGKAEAGVLQKLHHIGECKIKGDLYDLGEFPGLVCGENYVIADIYEVIDMSAIQDLDKFEQYDPIHSDRSLYVRRLVKPIDSKNDSWVYFYNQKIANATFIPSGDWLLYKKILKHTVPI